jgi:hypothetical protein
MAPFRLTGFGWPEQLADARLGHFLVVAPGYATAVMLAEADDTGVMVR